ncbi:MAG: glycosyltransferase family 39 protein [Deltaproteobacteria bacterium]|nr:glycosyltransferase family 39 protein [Deltaproteobacteria bacterium]
MPKKCLVVFIVLYCLMNMVVLGLKLPQEREGWIADIAYHWNVELTGSMAQDIPWSALWATGRGRGFYFIHHVFYKIFNVGLFQGRILTFLSALLLLFLVFRWTKEHVSNESALFSTLFLMLSYSFWPFLPVVSQDIAHCLFFFMAFYSLFVALSRNKTSFFIIAGFISALSVEISHRGIQTVLCTYIVFFLFSKRNTFLKHMGLLLSGSLIAFVLWYCLNVFPMGIENFIQYQFFPSRTEHAPHFLKLLLNEVSRFFLYLKSQNHFATFEISYIALFLFLFFKYKLKEKYAFISKFILCWLIVSFIIFSLLSQVDLQISQVYMLLYIIPLCLLCGMSFHELMLRHKKIAQCLLGSILMISLSYQGIRFLTYAYPLLTQGQTLASYHDKLKSYVDLNKNIIGETEYWYAFTDAQYYGGGFYLFRLMRITGELRYSYDYPNTQESAKAMLNVLKKRQIGYLVTCTEPNYLRDMINAYFPERKLPEKNFKFIDKVKHNFHWFYDQRPGPACHYNIEIYKVLSYEP